MKRVEAEALGDVLRRAIEEQNMTQKLLETRACAIFPEMLGRDLASLCGQPTVNAGTMTVPVANASLRQDLAMCRSRLMEALNKKLGQNVISGIRFTS